MFQHLLRRSTPRRNVLTAPALALRGRAEKTLNRVPDLSDWRVGSRFTEIWIELGCRPYIHRKAWEWCICIEGLERLNVIHPGAHAISVGAGYESPLFYFANKIERMVATDLYDNPQHEGHPDMLSKPWSFAPFEYRRDHLQVLRMSGSDLQFPDNTFDFAFCLSSIEHFGSRDIIQKSLSEIRRVLRPKGIACIITELVLEGSPHDQYFTPSELDRLFLQDPSFGLVGGEPAMTIAIELMSMPVDVDDPDDIKSSPHVVLMDKERKWTSFSMFLQKRI